MVNAKLFLSPWTRDIIVLGYKFCYYLTTRQKPASLKSLKEDMQLLEVHSLGHF